MKTLLEDIARRKAAILEREAKARLELESLAILEAKAAQDAADAEAEKTESAKAKAEVMEMAKAYSGTLDPITAGKVFLLLIRRAGLEYRVQRAKNGDCKAVEITTLGKGKDGKGQAFDKPVRAHFLPDGEGFKREDGALDPVIPPRKRD